MNAFNFVDNSKKLEAEYVYGANGQLTQDANKKIASIRNCFDFILASF